MAQQYFYIVSTYKYLAGEKYSEPQLYGIFLNNITEWAKKYENYFLVEEHGDLGNSTHFNLIIRTTQTNTNLQKLFKNAIYKKHGFTTTEHSVKIRLVNDLSTLITGYLEKEEDCKILLNKGFDLEELKKNKVNKPKKIHRDLIHVNLETAPHIIYEYIHENEIIYNKQEQPIAEILNKMFKDGYAVLGLIKHSRLIKHALNTLFDFNTENLSEYIEKSIERENSFYHFCISPQEIKKHEYPEIDYWEEYLEGTEEQEPLRPCMIDVIKKTNIKVKF